MFRVMRSEWRDEESGNADEFEYEIFVHSWTAVFRVADSTIPVSSDFEVVEASLERGFVFHSEMRCQPREAEAKDKVTFQTPRMSG